MKLQVKQLDTATTNTIAVALEHYADHYGYSYSATGNACLELSAMFRYSIVLLVSEGYDAPEDDVQVLGRR